MANPEALGAQLYNPFIAPNIQAKLMKNQAQQRLAEALLQQGATPLDTSNRQIGGVAYAISPTESLAKLAQGIVGQYGQNQAIDNYADIGQSMGGGSASNESGTSSNPWIDANGNPSTYANIQIAQGNRAASEAVQTALKERNSTISDPMISATINGQEGMYPTSVVRQLSQGGRNNVQINPTPQSAPPVMQGALPPPGNTPQLQDIRQQMGMQTPPVDQQLAANIPQVPSMDLMRPNNMGTPNPGADAAIPPPAAPAYGKTVLTPQQQSALEIQKANAIAQGAVQPAGAKTEAEDTAKNLVDATKTYNVAVSSFPRAMQRFEQLRQASKNASSGGGVSDKEPEHGLVESLLPDVLTNPDYARSFARTWMGQKIEPETATANQTLDQAAKQGILSELGPQLQGLKGNRYLETIASGASGLNPADPDSARQNAINGLQDQYISNMRSLAEQRRQSGDKSAPTDMDLAILIAQHAGPSHQMISIIDPKGNLGRVSADHLPALIRDGGQLR